jgi:hypothetical protein
MCDRCNPKTPATPGSFVCDDIPTSPGGTSRRKFLKSGVGIAAVKDSAASCSKAAWY